MDFSSHAVDIRNRLRRSLRSGSKLLIVKELARCVSSAKSLLKINAVEYGPYDFDFWLYQMDSTDIADIPMTQFGLEETKRLLEAWTDFSQPRHSLHYTMLEACVYLLTYSNEDDECLAQSQYHYYYFMPEKLVFKLSDLGFSDLPEGSWPTSWSDVRIARTSDLDIEPLELI